MTTLHLSDFLPLQPMLRDKLSSNQRNRISFSANFEQIQSLGQEDSDSYRFSYPKDVKISYQMGIVFVSDFGNRKIALFNLFTKMFLYSIELDESPQCLAVDEDDFDNLFITLSFTKVCKLRIWLMLDDVKYTKVWERGEKAKNFRQVRQELNLDEIDLASDVETAIQQPSQEDAANSLVDSSLEFYYPIGISVRNKQVYVCDSGHNRIVILSSLDGSFIRSISSFTFSLKSPPGIISSQPLFETSHLHEPWMIDFSLAGELIISEYWNGSIKILRESPANPSQLELVCSFIPEGFLNDDQDSVNSSDLFGICPLGICIDKSRENTLRHEKIIVSSPLKNRILAFEWNSSGLVGPQKDERLKLVRSYGSFGPLYCPFGLTIDDQNGQLLVADENNHSIKIKL